MKKIIVSLLLFLPLCMVAQEQKIAYVNSEEIFYLMPEFEKFQKDYENEQKAYTERLEDMKREQDRITASIVAKGDSLTENIRMIHLNQIQGIQENMENLLNSAQQELGKKQQDFQVAQFEKIQKAVDSVCEENGYAYVLDARAITSIGNGAINATDKVKTKLGIK